LKRLAVCHGGRWWTLRGIWGAFEPEQAFGSLVEQPDPPDTRGNIPSVIEQAVVSLTTEAQTRLKELLAKEGNPQLALRIFVSGGGCSGMQYGMAFDDMRRAEDVTIDQDGVQIVIDDFSAPYIRGSEIDYVDSLMGAGFTVHNPNAVHSCSCGHSFDTGDDAGNAQACGCGH
jgi:iron-sulfur cluster assembly protein